MLRRIISATFIITLFTTIICTPLFAILAIIKLCGAISWSWLACCSPVIVVLAILPFLLISKFLIDQKI